MVPPLGSAWLLAPSVRCYLQNALFRQTRLRDIRGTIKEFVTMGDAAPGPASAADRAAWLRDPRRVNERQEDALAPDYDATWGRVGTPTGRSWRGSCG
jgi:hypothetical protein